MNQLLATDTADAEVVIRSGGLVVKHYRRTHFLWRTPELWGNQLADRIAFSRIDHGTYPFIVNPVLFWHERTTFSAYIDGRRASIFDCLRFDTILNDHGFPDIGDVLKPENVIEKDGVFYLIDFYIKDWEGQGSASQASPVFPASSLLRGILPVSL